MTVLEKIKRCVELVWDFEEIYDWSDIEAFCGAELGTYPQHDEILDYFKQIEELEKEKDKAWWEGFDTCKAKAGEANVKLNDELEKLKKQLEELPDKWCRNKDDYCPHLAKLEKENARLKADYKGLYKLREEENKGISKKIAELEAQIEKMKCCGNCIHCKYDENQESYEFCEKHQQVVNIAIVPCSEWKWR